MEVIVLYSVNALCCSKSNKILPRDGSRKVEPCKGVTALLRGGIFTRANNSGKKKQFCRPVSHS